MIDIPIHNGEVDTTPTEAGYDTEALNRLDNLFTSLIGEHQLQGASYMLSRHGRTFANRAFGTLRQDEGSPPLQTDSIRRIASITKMFTLVCILRLMEEGKLYLRQPVKDWIEEFKHATYEKINIYHLLTHTSGLHPDGGYFTEPYPAGWWDYEFAFEDYNDEGEVEHKQLSPGEAGAQKRSRWIKAMLAGPPISEPGESWNYSSAGYSLLGELIRRISGMSYEDYVKQTIIEPLGLTRTSFRVQEAMYDEVCVTNDWDLQRLTDREDRTYLAPRAGGGLYSTLADLDRFGRMLLGNGTLDGVKIISRKSVEMLTADQFTNGIRAYHWGENLTDFHAGLGVTLGRVDDPFKGTTFLHEGAGRSALMIDKKEGLVAVFFVPTNVDWVPESMISVKNIIWSGIQ